MKVHSTKNKNTTFSKDCETCELITKKSPRDSFDESAYDSIVTKKNEFSSSTGSISVSSGSDSVSTDDEYEQITKLLKSTRKSFLVSARASTSMFLYDTPSNINPGKSPPESFIKDLKEWKEGTIPHSFVVAITIGFVCGIAATIYYKLLWIALQFFWHDLPVTSGFTEKVDRSLWWLWIPIVGFLMPLGVGASVKYVGEPGDLPYVVRCVHQKTYIDMDHMYPMILASMFSIIGGGSLGPEAPLVAVCACLAGYVSRSIFKTKNANVIRKHTLMGMCSALAAFFGCPLGGSLFALEVNNRFGFEYFEHAIEAIFAGEICLTVFRWASSLPIEPIWTLDAKPLTSADPGLVLVGILLGLFGALTAYLFTRIHGQVMMHLFSKNGLIDNGNAIYRALLGASVIVSLGLLMPQTMFWGEFEFQQVATLAPASHLEHVWPTTGLLDFEMDSAFKCLLVGLGKLVAISFTVAGGYRGGFIFPFFTAGAAMGRAITFIFPSIPVPVATLCIAAGINVSITRTALGTTVILTFLSNELNASSAILAASLMSLFATFYMPFMKTQVPRSDLRQALFYQYPDNPSDAKIWEQMEEEDYEDDIHEIV